MKKYVCKVYVRYSVMCKVHLLNSVGSDLLRLSVLEVYRCCREGRLQPIKVEVEGLHCLHWAGMQEDGI